MKIVHMIPDLWNGGAERFVIDLCSETVKHEKVVLCSFKDIEEGMIFIKQLSPSIRLVTLSKKKGFDFKFMLRLFKFLSKENPDILNTHLTAVNYCFLPLVIFRKIKAFHTIHSSPEREAGNKIFRIIKKLFFSTGRIVPVLISNRSSEKFKQIYKRVDPEVIFNGAYPVMVTSKYPVVKKEVESYKYDQNTKVFLAVGNHLKCKNYDLMIRTFRKLYNEKNNVILIIIGYDNSAEKYEWNRISALKPENVFLLGLKNNVADYMNCADCFCMSSKVEGMPISVIEAFSQGLPVLSTPAGGVPDMVHNYRNGLLSSDFSLENYYKMIKTFLSMTTAEVESIKENNKNLFLQRFTIEITARNYLKCYNKYISRIPE